MKYISNWLRFNEKRAQKELKKGYRQAQSLLREPDKLEQFLQTLEKNLDRIPILGKEFKMLPLLISLLRSYFKKDYQEVPVATIVAIISALIYFLSPMDGLPDFIPLYGYSDDAIVLGVCWKIAQYDVKDYIEWRKKNHEKEVGEVQGLKVERLSVK
ncbi:TPA: YkvA family protein [Streptococcus suis]